MLRTIAEHVVLLMIALAAIAGLMALVDQVIRISS